jgi:hypothetical protein
LKNERVGYGKDIKTIKKLTNSDNTNSIKESSFLVGNDYKVKVVVDIPQNLVKEYIDKVKSETDKNPLDNFSESEIAEQIVTFIIKNNLLIDKLTPDFTVGSESVGNSEKNQTTTQSDAETLSDDLGVDNGSEDDSDGEIEFKDFDEKESVSKETISDDEESDGEIEFDDSGSEEKDLGEEREADKSETEADSDFDEIEFDEDSGEVENKPKTIGDLKKSQGKEIEKKHKNEESGSEASPSEEEEEIEDVYKKIGYNIGYYEKMKNQLYKKI